MIVLLGSEGSMGRRYQSILRYLSVPYKGFDLEGWDSWEEEAAKSQGVIIATPTPSHAAFVRTLGSLEVPILCEKPLSKNLHLVDEMLAVKNPFQMMAQYRYCDWKAYSGETYYNYYQSGSDGLPWDCLILLGLARGLISLEQTSPIWRCALNGRVLSLDEAQESYVWAVEDWLQHPEGDREWIRKAHYRAAAFPGGTIDVHTLDAMTPRSPNAAPVTPAAHEGR